MRSRSMAVCGDPAFLADRDYWPILGEDDSSVETGPALRTYSFDADLGKSRIRVTSNRSYLYLWIDEIVNQLKRVAALRANWDSYSARPIPQRTLEYALQVILELIRPSVPDSLPHIGATVHGGVTIEWSTPTSGLEITVHRPFQVSAYFWDEVLGEEWEKEVGIELEQLSSVVRHFTG